MPWSWRGPLVASVVAAAALSAQQGVVMPATHPAAGRSVQDAVARYAAGAREDAGSQLDASRLTVGALTDTLDAWIAAAPAAERPHRQRVAAAFALDAVWATTRGMLNASSPNLDPWGRVTPGDPDHVAVTSNVALGMVAEWVAGALPRDGAPDDLERTLWLTAVGVAEDGHAWHRLASSIVPAAARRLAGEPRLRLAAVLARTNIALGPLRHGDSPSSRFDALRVESLSSGETGPIPDAERAFRPLLEDATLAGEVELRLGYLELRRGHWADALGHLDAARTKAGEPVLRAAADYFSGWIDEQQRHPDDAMTAYRRALALTPAMRNLATRLAALLFLRNAREEAYAVLDPALNARPAPVDLLLQVERADARFVPGWLVSIRKALP